MLEFDLRWHGEEVVFSSDEENIHELVETESECDRVEIDLDRLQQLLAMLGVDNMRRNLLPTLDDATASMDTRQSRQSGLSR